MADSVYFLWKTYLLYASPYFLLEARKPQNRDTKLAGWKTGPYERGGEMEEGKIKKINMRSR